MKQASLITRIKRLFNWDVIVRDKPRLYTGGRKLEVRYDDIPPDEVDAYMEKLLTKVKKVPYVGMDFTGSGANDYNLRFAKNDYETTGSGDYSLRFNLQNMCEDGDIPEWNEVKNVAAKKPDADVITNQILAELSRTSEYSQDLQISFMMKGGWKGYIKVWLYPKIYYGKPSENKTDFSEIYAVEKDPSFLNWESIYYRDSADHGTFSIYLNTLDKWDRHRSHYSGICSVSWLDFVPK